MASTSVLLRRIAVVAALVLVVAAGVAFLQGRVPCETLASQPACEVAMQPGPVEDTFGIVRIDDVEVFRPETGVLNLTTVAVQDDLGLGGWLVARTTRNVDLLPREEIYPPGVDREEVAELNRLSMQDSQLIATIVALEAVGYELEGEGAEVVAVQEDAVTDALEVGDVIVALDGAPIRESVEVVEAVQAREVGEQVTFTLRRDGAERTAQVTLGSAPDDAERAYVGVLLTTDLDLPVDISVDAGVIGGPSAGLVFALTLLELLEPEDLLGGRVVAGTGTLARDGAVGGVGGVRQKLAGASAPRDGSAPAEVFLVPEANLADARNATVAEDVLVVPVATLDDARAALRALRDGQEPTEGFVLAAD